MTQRLRAGRELAAPVVVTAAILAAAAGSAIQRDLFHAGRPARWGMLLVLLAVALAEAFAARRTWRVRPAVVALVGLFCALCVVSAGWSTSPHSTLGRAAGEIVVVVSVTALAGAAAGSPRRYSLLIDALLAAVAVVAVASVAYWLAVPSGRFGAFQAAFLNYPSRFRGLEFNPNTLAMLLAIGMPAALALALDGRRTRAYRAALAVLLVLCGVELSLSGSRGAMLAALGSCLLVAALLPQALRRRAALAALVVAGLAVVAWGSTIPKPLPASAFPRPPAPVHRGIDAERVLPLEAEIGNPWWTHRTGNVTRSLFNTSVRLRALKGGVERARARPLLGWGFGAETDAFVNRYYGFDSQNPENGYVGLLLQLGVVGLLAFLAAAGACLAAGVAAARRTPGYATAAALGAAAAGLLLGISQSYFHGPGGIAYLALWLSLLLASVAGLSPARTRPAG